MRGWCGAARHGDRGSLATSWEPIGDGEGWRFNLREGVTFHDGAEFTAEDVLFSYQRASSEEADVRSWFATVSDVVVVDDLPWIS
jgi:peptide/nickel transport system substrate-binding protein